MSAFIPEPRDGATNSDKEPIPMTTTDNALGLLPSDDINPMNPADVARLADITGQSIPDNLTPAQTIVAVLRTAQAEMNRRRAAHKPLYIEIGPDTYQLMTDDTADAHEAQRLCSDLYRNGWMVGVVPVDMTPSPNHADHGITAADLDKAR